MTDDQVQLQNLTIDTEYISRASRALAPVTPVKRATASEIAVHSGTMQETWIDGDRADGWIAVGWTLVGIVICCILMGLVLLWRNTVRIVDMIDDEKQTLEEGRCDPNVQMRVMITKNGKAAHCRDDCPFLLKSYPIQSLSWCSHCDPSDDLEKRTWRRWDTRRSFEPQSVLYQFPVSRSPDSQSHDSFTPVPCCKYPDLLTATHSLNATRARLRHASALC